MQEIKMENLRFEDLFALEPMNYYRRLVNKGNLNQLQKAEEIWEQTHSAKEVEDFAKDIISQMNVNPLLIAAEIPAKYKNASFDGYKPQNQKQKKAKEKAQEYCIEIKNHLQDGKNFIFLGMGDVGTGKTYLSICMLKDIIKRQISAKFISAIDMICSIKEDFKIDKYANVPVLIIDDLGKERSTDWVCEQLYAIINSRYVNNRPTIITTEDDISDLENSYDNKGKAILSRLKENIEIVPMLGSDYRQRRF